MKTNIISYITFGALMAGSLTGCQESWKPVNERQGQVALSSLGINVDSHETLTNSDASKAKQSREAYDVNDYIVRIYDAQNAMVANWRYAEMPEIFTLPVGQNYRVDVVSHEVQKAEWSAPLFTGSKSFDIADSEITDIGTVTCTFQSLKVSVEFSSELKAAMGDDAQVRVVANDLGELVFTASESRSGYFEVVDGSNTLAYFFEGSVNGNYETFHNIYTDITAGQHRIIKFSLKQNNTEPDVETGIVTPGTGINVNVVVFDENKNGEVPNEEEHQNPNRPNGENFNDEENPGPGPGPDDPVTHGEISFTAPELLFDTPMDPAQQSNGVVDIHVEKGIEHLQVEIQTNSDDFKGTLEDVDVPLTFDMAQPTAADEGVMELLGASADDILGKTDVKFDITEFLPLLFFSGEHKFIITVTDKDGYSDSRTIIFVVK
ncbi:MAG: DUF4493 domain-containing protein [Muribaculaceae bacterium]|nr:DUF4493 domain-containing protein [Muribaculaceae bacterium]